MAFTKITNAELNKKGATKLPNQPKIGAQELKAVFEEPAKTVVAPAYNRLIDELEAETGAASLGAEGGTVQEILNNVTSSVSTALVDVEEVRADISAVAIRLEEVAEAAGDMFKSEYDSNGDVETAGGIVSYVSSQLVNCYEVGDTIEYTLGDDSDSFPFYDDSASAKRRTTWGAIKTTLINSLYSVFVAKRSLPLDIESGGTGNNKGYIRTGQRENTSVGNNATCEGDNTAASGANSHAEGFGTSATKACAHAEGNGTTASGNYSHAEGSDTTASGSSSHAEGQNTEAKSTGAHAEGYYTSANGANSHASGKYTVAGYASQTVVGKYNSNKSATLFEVGNGTADEARSNAFEVYNDGTISQDEGATKFKFTSYNGEDGYYDKNGVFHEFGGSGTGDMKASDYDSDDTVKNAGGIDAYVTSQISSQILNCNEVVLGGALTVGERSQGSTIGTNSVAEGNETVASGQYSHAEGSLTVASGQSAHAEGTITEAVGKNSHAGGYGTIAGYDNQTTVGKCNSNKSGTYFEVGNGTADNARSNAFEVYANGDINMTGAIKQNGVTVLAKVLDQTTKTTASGVDTFTFTDSAITTNGDFDYSADVYGVAPIDVVPSSGQLLVKFSSSDNVTKCRVYIRG